MCKWIVNWISLCCSACFISTFRNYCKWRSSNSSLQWTNRSTLCWSHSTISLASRTSRGHFLGPAPCRSLPGCWRQLLSSFSTPVGPVLSADSRCSCLQGFLVDRAGRKALLWKTYAAMALALGLLTVTLALQVRPHLCIWAKCHIFVFCYMADINTIFLSPKNFLAEVEVLLQPTIILTVVCFQPCTCRFKSIAFYKCDHCQHCLLEKCVEVENTDVCHTM